MSLTALDDTTVVYVPGFGETTVGAIRATAPEETPALDERTATVKMWGHIATHPHDKPWLKNSGRSRAGRRA